MKGRPETDKFLSTLGLCKKAGKLAMGFDVVADGACKGSVILIVTAQDLSPKSRKEIALVADRYRVKIGRVSIGMDEIWRRTGRRSGILGVMEPGLARLLEDSGCIHYEEDSGRTDGAFGGANGVNEEE